MPPRSAFFVRGDTPLFVDTDCTRFYPLAGNVKVSRKSMLNYLYDLQSTAGRKQPDNGLYIRVSHSDKCFFV